MSTNKRPNHAQLPDDISNTLYTRPYYKEVQDLINKRLSQMSLDTYPIYLTEYNIIPYMEQYKNNQYRQDMNYRIVMEFYHKVKRKVKTNVKQTNV